VSSPKTSIEKGKLLERFVAELLRNSGLDPRARRQVGSGNGLKKGDIDNNIGWCIECKNTKTFNWKSTAEQVARESMNHQKEVIIWHPPNRPFDDSIAIINVNEFIDLLVKVQNSRDKEDILDKYQIKSHLEKATYHLKQVYKDV